MPLKSFQSSTEAVYAMLDPGTFVPKLSPQAYQVLLLNFIAGFFVWLIVRRMFNLREKSVNKNERPRKMKSANSPTREIKPIQPMAETRTYDLRRQQPVNYCMPTDMDPDIVPTQHGIDFKLDHVSGRRTTDTNHIYTLEYLREICRSWGIPDSGDKEEVSSRLWSIFRGRIPA